MTAIARAALNRAHQLMHDLETRYPGVWQTLDDMRRNPPTAWPDWCLLPMAGPASVAMSHPRLPLIPQLAALYAWRYSRSVYVFEPNLMRRLLTQIPDAIALDDLVGLPDWCVYVAGDNPEQPGGLWIHLEHDVNTGRPELRLLLDIDGGSIETIMGIPVYLDRPNLVEAIADAVATTRSTLGPTGIRTGLDVRGGQMNADIANLTEQVERYLAIAAYLSRPEADIREQGRPDVRPGPRYRTPPHRDTIWQVGYSLTP